MALVFVSAARLNRVVMFREDCPGIAASMPPMQIVADMPVVMAFGLGYPRWPAPAAGAHPYAVDMPRTAYARVDFHPAPGLREGLRHRLRSGNRLRHTQMSA